MTLEEGALMEPLAVGIHACNRAGVRPGDAVAILGAGTIGCVSLLAAKAFGAEPVVVSDVVTERLERATALGASHVVDARSESLVETVLNVTKGAGANVGIDCSGVPSALSTLLDTAASGGRVVMIGMGPQPVEVDMVTAMVKETDILGVFRYANAYPKAIELVESGSIDVAPLVTDRFQFVDAISAFEFALKPNADTCKIMLSLD
jgi:L-iditol 2-dehydrogenase